MRAAVVRCVTAGGLVLALAMGSAGTGSAVPPPPGNPSDSDISAGQTDVKDKAAQVGDLTNQLAAADSKLIELQSQVERKMEEVNKALVDLQTAQDAAQKAKDAADAAKVEADAAGNAIDDARKHVDAFAAASYQQGSAVGSTFTTLFDATSPENLLARAQLLDAVSGSELHAMEGMQRANIDKANKESAGRKALEIAKQKQDEATAAKKKVDAAMAAAVAARQSEAAQAQQLQASKADVETRLAAAQDKVGDLQAQRQRYQDWLEQKKREEEAAAAAAAHQGGGGGARPVAPANGNRASIVINRAMAQLGVTYAWGGGTPSGPSRGISDGGGDADLYGDYNKIGFDCSGLMVYAFAGAGVYLPHYSGYQYYAGAHIPLSEMAPGDMLFYGDLSNIHHVTMYVGGGRMIEAPYSGAVVRLVPVRWGEIMPYATRVL